MRLALVLIALVACSKKEEDAPTERVTTTRPAPPPDAAPALEGKAIAIDADGNSTCALLSSGQVVCWGDASIAEYGDARLRPTPVVGITAASQLSVGDGFACALENGAVRCWGKNHLSQLGGNTAGRGPITTIDTGAVAVKVRSATGCALIGDGTVDCWGYALSRVAGTSREPALREIGGGELVQADLPKEQTEAAPIAGAAGGTALLVGHWSACIRTDADLLCWGSNHGEHLGDLGDRADLSGHVLAPTPTPALRGLDALALGKDEACGVDRKRRAICTGIPFTPTGPATIRTVDSVGEFVDLQDKLAAERSQPRPVPELEGAVAFAFGDFHGCALIKGGTVRCWGDQSERPVEVPGISGATAVAVGMWHSCALLGDGSVRCWGRNSFGQLGDGTETDRPTPGDVIGLPH